MQNVHGFLDSNRVNRSICFPIVVLDYLENLSISKAFKRFGICMLFAQLSEV